jgi:hypothetical protein
VTTADAELGGGPALTATDNAIVRWTRTDVVGGATAGGEALAAEVTNSRLEMFESSVTLDPATPGTTIRVTGAFAELVADASVLSTTGASQHGVRLDTGAQATLRSSWVRVADGTALDALVADLELVDVDLEGGGEPGPDAPAIVAVASTLSATRVAMLTPRGRAILIGVFPDLVGDDPLEGLGTTAVLEDLSITNVVHDDEGDAIGIDIAEGSVVTARRVRIRQAGTVGIRAGFDTNGRFDARVTLVDVAIVGTGFAVACGVDCVDGIGLHVTPFGFTDASRFFLSATAGCGMRIDASAVVSVLRSEARSGALTHNRYGLCVAPPYDPGAVALNMPGVLFRENRADGYVIGDHATCIEGSARCGELTAMEMAP